MRHDGRQAVQGKGGAPAMMVLALESSAGWTAEARFVQAVLGAIRAELPYARYFAAGREARRRGMCDGEIARAAIDWMDTTLHPSHMLQLQLDDPHAVLNCMNAYNSRCNDYEWDDKLELYGRRRPERGAPPNGRRRAPCWILASDRGDFRLHATRLSPDGIDDPAACQSVSLAAIEYLVGHAQRASQDATPRTLSAMARLLGVTHSVAAEAAGVLEREGGMPVEALARQLGCSKRTLERALQAAGTSAGQLRLAAMMVGAANQLTSKRSLTEIAADQGFADLAHMSRAFQASCGMAPSALRASMALKRNA